MTFPATLAAPRLGCGKEIFPLRYFRWLNQVNSTLSIRGRSDRHSQTVGTAAPKLRVSPTWMRSMRVS